MNEFTHGDSVEIICFDGREFRGVLKDWTPQYIVLAPHNLAFPCEDIVVMTHA